MYTALKHSHILFMLLSICLFILRFIWCLVDSKIRTTRWVTIVAHSIDTLLIATGIGLIFVTGFVPFTPTGLWLSEKLLCVVAYLVLGRITLHYSHGNVFRVFAFCGALGWAYLAANLAITKIPYF